MMDVVKHTTNIFAHALVDSISIHKTIPVLWSNRTATRLTFQILVTNAVLLLGSILIFHRGIEPLLQKLEVNSPSEESRLVEWLLFALYQWLWLVPIWGLCYACSTAWYQELAGICTRRNFTSIYLP